MEQVRADGGAQARASGPRGAAQERHHRRALPRRRAARGGVREAAPGARRHAARDVRRRRHQGAQPEAGSRHRRPRPLEKRLADLDAMGLDMQVIKPPPPQCYYAVPLDIAVEGGAHGQRRHRRVRGAEAGPPQGLRHRADARRQRGGQGAGALRRPSSASRACRC